jgi:phosphoglycerate kinase
MKSLRNIDPEGRKFLVRCDLDVLDEKGEINEDFRLISCVKTLNFILQGQGFAYICGHIGKTQEPNEIFSTQKLKDFFLKHLVNENFELMENLRFDPREEQKDEDFAREIALGKDIYVNESFATSHRDHSSITLVPKLLPSYIGFHFEEELENLDYVRNAHRRPINVLVGGAKIESKLPTIQNFLKFADHVLVGGRLMFEESLKNNPKIILGVDSVDGKDIGPSTIEEFKKYINDSKIIFWAGPLGMVEDPKYTAGSLQIADLISKSGAYSVVGGGDTIAFLDKHELTGRFSFVSVGGSAMLEYLSTGELVGLTAVLRHNGEKNS